MTALTTHRPPARCPAVALLTLTLALFGGSGPAWSSPSDDCPDVSGLYRISGKNDFGTPLRNAVEALQASRSGSGGGGGYVQLSKQSSGDIGVSWTDGRTSVMAQQPDHLLSRGGDFKCRRGEMVFNRSVSTFRTIDGRTYQGEASVRMGSAAGGLRFALEFSGVERVSVYSYDSANVSVPKPFFRRTLVEELKWPRASDAESFGTTATKHEAEPDDVTSVRKNLTALLQGVQLGGLERVRDGVLASLQASSREAAMQFEDLLRSSGLNYQIRREPVWSDRSWFMEVLIRTGPKPAASATATGTASAMPDRPSPSRVQYELERKMSYSLVNVTRVVEDAGGYIATVQLMGDATSEQAFARLRANSKMFSRVEALDEKPDPQYPPLRVARWRLVLSAR